jgi:hypothetical protein
VSDDNDDFIENPDEDDAPPPPAASVEAARRRIFKEPTAKDRGPAPPGFEWVRIPAKTKKNKRNPKTSTIWGLSVQTRTCPTCRGTGRRWAQHLSHCFDAPCASCGGQGVLWGGS